MNFQRKATNRRLFRNNINNQLTDISQISTLSPPQLFPERLPISTAKFKDLQNLCTTDVISEYYHAFYASLPFNKAVKDVAYFDDLVDIEEYEENNIVLGE